MSYNAVKVSTHLTGLADGLKKLPANTPRSNGDKWDKDVAKALAEGCSLAEKNIKSNLDLCTKKKDLAQQEMNRVEQSVKNGKMDSTMLSAIVSVEKDIQTAVKVIQDDIQDLAHANLEYRGNWPSIARGILKDQSILQPFLQPRETSISVTAQTVKKCKERCEEYAVRIPEYIKQAQHMMAANKDGTVYLKELQEFTKTAQEAAKAIGDLHHQAHNP